MTYEDALAILRDGWPVAPEDLTQIAAHAWDEGAEACHFSEGAHPRNPYRASED